MIIRTNDILKYTRCKLCNNKLYIGKTSYEFNDKYFCTKFCMDRFIDSLDENIVITEEKCDEDDA